MPLARATCRLRIFSRGTFQILSVILILLVMDICLPLPSCTSFLHVKALESGCQQGLLKAPTLGALSSPLRQFMSILCCRMKANFQGLYMNPGLSRRRFRRFRGSSMPAEGRHGGMPHTARVVRALARPRCTSVGAAGYPTAQPSHSLPRAIWRKVLTFFTAFLSPEQVIFSQDPPVATGLGSTEQVPRLQEREDIECQLQGWEPGQKGTVGSRGR